jgi:hypothetical protein
MGHYHEIFNLCWYGGQSKLAAEYVVESHEEKNKSINSAQSNLEFEYLDEFVTEFETFFGYKSGAKMGLIVEKSQW